MHLFVLLVINLIEQLLPVVIKVKEKLFMLDHLGLAVEEHSSSLTEMLSCIKEVAHSVVMEAFSYVFEDINPVDNNTLCSFEQELLWVKECFSHSLNLFVVVVVDLSAVVKHITNI